MPLQGIRVLDLSRYPPGRFCTMILADFGAEVITIEMPRSGSDWQWVTDDTTPHYLGLNRNKRSIALNLRTEEGKKVFYRLAEMSDVILEGFRPGVVARLGVDYETIGKINPGIVYCSLSGYGQDGPYADRSGHDINYVGISGILDMSGYPNQPPAPIGTQIGDISGCFHATIGILLALLARGRTGRGQYIDVAMLDGLIDCLWINGAQYLLDGIPLSRGETLYNGAHPGYNIYETRDGKYITLGILEPQFWEALCRLLGQEDFIAHQDAVGEKRQEIFAHFRQAFRTKDRKEWLTILERADIPCGVVNNLEQAFSDPQVRHREMVSEVEHPLLGRLRQIAPAIKLSDTPAEVRTPPPIYGEHTDSILKELGYTKKEIDHLRQQGVIE